MNDRLNALLDEEVGADDGAFLPITDGRLHLAPADRR